MVRNGDPAVGKNVEPEYLQKLAWATTGSADRGDSRSSGAVEHIKGPSSIAQQQQVTGGEKSRRTEHVKR